MRNNKINIKLLATAVGGAAALAAYALFIRPWHLKWGATDKELRLQLPGDELVENPRLNATHAITINAPLKDVWPWLVQIGQKRGGFYSYTWLENLVGCDMRNADQIVPEWQNLKVGDEVWLHPKAPPLKVLAVEAGCYIVLENSWTFFLRPIDDHTTRLIIRGRGDFNPDLKSSLLNFILLRGIFEPAHFIMERKMMLGIKERAEATLTT
ncbi:MAG TPA: SRPBCC family protein [Pyrinomonadaceae bacterium]|nr:SRPBCC family protein [Pyrinomonadaceae bacterium]